MIKFPRLQELFSIDKLEDSSFRYDISFLRVIAVISVLLYHFNIFPFRSGFIGVDIFFVISGFLMTKIILTGFDRDNFNLNQFYQKRIARIIPALLFLLVIFFVVVYVSIPTQFINYLHSTFSSSLFFSNILYYHNNGYFSSDSHNNFLLHTWSLSVEWQFYIIYPILLILLRNIYRNKRKLFIGIFIGLIICSFVSMIYHNINDRNYSYFIFYTRAWEMLFGGLALFYTSCFVCLTNKIKILISGISFFILGVSLVFFGGQSWPSHLTLIPVLATALIIALNINFAIFNNKRLIYVGNISYSLYLYHWPIFVFSKYFGVSKGFNNIIILVILSLFFAIISYEFIEKKSSFKHAKLVLGFSLLIFGCTFYVSKLDARTYSIKYGNLINVTTHYKDDEAAEQFNFGSKHFLGQQRFEEFDLSFLKIDTNQKNIVLLGDSHGGMFAKTFENLLMQKNINLIQITADSTYPMINADGFYKGPVNYFNFIFSSFFAKNRDEIDLVVIISNYAAYPEKDLDAMINFTEKYFKKLDIKCFYLGQTQNYPIEFPTYFYMKDKYNVNYSDENRIFKNTHDINNFLINKLGDRYINILDYPVKTVSISNYPFMYDKNHLTFYGTELYKGIINKNISSALK